MTSSVKIYIHNAVHYGSAVAIGHTEAAMKAYRLSDEQQARVLKILSEDVSSASHATKKEREQEVTACFPHINANFHPVQDTFKNKALKEFIRGFLSFKSFFSSRKIAKSWNFQKDSDLIMLHLKQASYVSATELLRLPSSLKNTGYQRIFQEVQPQGPFLWRMLAQPGHRINHRELFNTVKCLHFLDLSESSATRQQFYRENEVTGTTSYVSKQQVLEMLGEAPISLTGLNLEECAATPQHDISPTLTRFQKLEHFFPGKDIISTANLAKILPCFTHLKSFAANHYSSGDLNIILPHLTTLEYLDLRFSDPSSAILDPVIPQWTQLRTLYVDGFLYPLDIHHSDRNVINGRTLTLIAKHLVLHNIGEYRYEWDFYRTSRIQEYAQQGTFNAIMQGLDAGNDASLRRSRFGHANIITIIGEQLDYSPFSDLGNFYRAVLQDAPSLSSLFAQLNQSDRDGICFCAWELAGRPAEDNWGDRHLFDYDTDLLLAVKKWIVSTYHGLQSSQKDRIHGNVYQLAGSPQTNNPDWGRSNAETVIARLADALDMLRRTS